MINIQKEKIEESIDYKDEVIREKIAKEFFYKCYLCEGKPIQNYEIDHFYPKNIYPHLVNQYENLFFICSKCNKIREKNSNSSSENEILNSCEEDVENSIHLSIKLDDCKKAILIPIYTEDEYFNKKIDNTIKFLDKIYNGVGTTSEAYRCLRDDIVDEVLLFQSELQMYQDDYLGTRFEKRFKEKLLKELESSSLHSGFKKTTFLNMKIKL